jgi:ATP-dependent Clp protease protease subunit
MDDETNSFRNSEIWVTKFDEDGAKKFRDSVMAIAKHDSNRPIAIYIDSYGGMVDSLATMIETLDEVLNPIVTVCVGKAMSCGAILLSHGDVRFCGKHSRIMVHEVSSGTVGDVHDMHADVQEVKRLNEYFMGILAQNCGFKNYDELRKVIKEQDGRDRYLNAQAALEFGIIDAVGTPKISSAAMYEINIAPQKKQFEKRNKTKLTSKKTTGKTKKNKSDTKR